MLNQEIAIALMQASITGAGLVLAVYALIVSLSRRIFEQKVHTLVDLTQRFKETAKEIEPNYKDFQKLKGIFDQITWVQEIPDYLRYGFGLTFFGYVACVLMSYAWLVNWEQPTIDPWLSLVFVITTIAFLIVGLISIKDIHRIMKGEFEDIKKTLEIKNEGTDAQKRLA